MNNNLYLGITHREWLQNIPHYGGPGGVLTSAKLLQRVKHLANYHEQSFKKISELADIADAKLIHITLLQACHFRYVLSPFTN